MTTTALPRRRLSWRWFIAGIFLIVAVILGGIYLSGSRQAAPIPTAATVAVRRGPLVVHVAASGSVAAARTLDLSFQNNGTVTEVLVKEGDVVETGQVLARLDDQALQMDLENKRLSLLSAMAQLAQAEGGDATPQDIASAEASVRSAEAQLRSAEAQLNGLLAGPDAANIASAQSQLDQAQASLRQVQAGPSQSELISARTELANAEAALQAAQAAYDQVAWRPEISMMPQSVELQQATNNYQAAKARYDELMKGADPNEVASAQAQVRNAEAQLRAARQGATQAEIAQAQASVAQAQASLDQARLNLEALTAPQSVGNRSIQQIGVQQAEQAVKQAELALESAVLRAPFAGVISAVDLVPGGTVSTNGAVVTLIDRSTLHLDLRLSENDVARVALDQPVDVTIDSLGDWQTAGTVSYIAPAAEVTNDVVTYLIRVSFPDDDPAVKVGMTANAAITTAERENVLLVPNTTLLPKGTGRVVQVPNPDGTVREVEVTVGLTNGVETEIVSGLEEGMEIIALPTTGSNRSGFFGPP